MNCTFKNVTREILKIRRSTLKNFCNHFNINILFRVENLNIEKIDEIKDSTILEKNFVYFLIEIKTFLKFYEEDYYSDKTIDIIASKVKRKPSDIENYLKSKNYKVNPKNPYRYLSSFHIDYILGKEYPFTKYDKSVKYYGNYEYRPDDLNN